MKIKIIGTIHEVLPPRSGTGKNGFWESQDMIIKTGESQYGDEFVLVSMFGEKMMSNPKVGEFVKLECNLKASRAGDRWFNNLNLWRWEQTAPQLSEGEVTILERSNAEALEFDNWEEMPNFKELAKEKAHKYDDMSIGDLPF